jgi:hypothetical protein
VAAGRLDVHPDIHGALTEGRFRTFRPLDRLCETDDRTGCDGVGLHDLDLETVLQREDDVDEVDFVQASRRPQVGVRRDLTEIRSQMGGDHRRDGRQVRCLHRAFSSSGWSAFCLPRSDRGFVTGKFAPVPRIVYASSPPAGSPGGRATERFMGKKPVETEAMDHRGVRIAVVEFPRKAYRRIDGDSLSTGDAHYPVHDVIEQWA